MLGSQCNPVVVKIGGSVITSSEKPLTVNEQSMGRVAEAIASFYKQRSSTVSMALVHGGGSYGHYLVDKMLSEKGVLGPLEAAKVQLAMMELSTKLASVLLELGVPVVVHPAHSLCKGVKCDLSRFIDDILVGAVPMTYGDVVLTDSGGKVISGDQLAVEAATLLKAKCLIFVTSVPGVYSADGRLLSTYTGREKLLEMEGKAHDVTGGIRGKLKAALEYTRVNPDAVVRIVSPEDLLAALEGGDVGTLVKPWED